MKTDLRKQLFRLGRHQQKRIWLNRIIGRLPALLWWSAAILFLGGGIHQLMLPLDPLIVACIAILPFLLIISWISARVKPSAEEGAAAADRLLGANSLFVSAWELSRSATAIKGINRLLMARAETELPHWSLHFKKQPQRYMKPASLVATTLGFIGLFFLLMPPHVQTSEVPSTTTPSSQKKPVRLNRDPAVVLSELFKEKTVTTTAEKHLQQSTPFDSSKRADSQTPLLIKQAITAEISKHRSKITGQTTKQMPAKPSTFHEKLPPAQNGFLTSSSQNEGKKIAEQTAGNETAASSDKMINKAEEFDRVSLIDIETGADNQATAFDGTREGEKLIISAPAQSNFRQPARGHSLKVSQTDSGTLLTAEQRTLVWHYFKQLEKINEANE